MLFLKIFLWIVAVSKYLEKLQYSNTFVAIISTLTLLPKLMVLAAILTDIFLFQEFHYYPKCLFLLLLTLIYPAMIKIALTYYAKNYVGLASCLEITYSPESGKRSYKFPDRFGVSDSSVVDYFVEKFYLLVAKMPVLAMHYNYVKYYYKLHLISILIIILHLFGWITILIFGI